MWNMHSTLVMNVILATALSAQAQTALRPERNWFAAHRKCLGMQADPGWIMDLEAEDMEVFLTPDDALVILDPAPIRYAGNATACLRKSIQSTGGTRLALVCDVRHVDDSTLYGAYQGELSGTAVSVEQYLRERNGVALALVIVVTRIHGSEPIVRHKHAGSALALLGSIHGPRVPQESDPGSVRATGR